MTKEFEGSLYFFRKNGTNKLPEAIGTMKLPERQINGSSYTNIVVDEHDHFYALKELYLAFEYMENEVIVKDCEFDYIADVQKTLSQWHRRRWVDKFFGAP